MNKDKETNFCHNCSTDDSDHNCHKEHHHNKSEKNIHLNSHTKSHCSCHCNHNNHHNHACGCGHEHEEKSKADILRYIISGILVIIALIITDFVYISKALMIAASVLCGYKILWQGLKSILKFKFDENTLMAIASLSASIMGDFVEGYMIVLLFSIGEHMEDYAIKKSNKRIESLIYLTDEYTFDENGIKIDAKSIKKGNKFVVHPGDRVCTDATILCGYTTFDTSGITGETIPAEKTEGDKIISGYINTGSAVTCIADTDYSDSTVSKIKEYVSEASKLKSAPEKFITKFAKIYTPAIIICALMLGLSLSIFSITSTSEAIRRALTFMIASCPCALVISIPLSYYASIGTSCKNGILVKGAAHLNTVAKADTVVFDKTGTITEGTLKISEIICLKNNSEEEIIAYAKALEVHSSHPIAQAICKYPCLIQYTATEVKEAFGKGIEGIVNGKKVSLGNSKLNSNEANSNSDGLVLTIDSIDKAVIKLSDTIKNGTYDIIQQLHQNKIKNIYVLSGDSSRNVNELMKNLPNVCGKGDLLPHDKAEIIENLQKNHKVIYVGDGVNDAPALAIADFSIAVGSGSALALETGDASLISHSLKPVVSLLKIAKCTLSTVYINIVFSLLVKAVVLVLSVFGIAPIWLGLLSDVGVLILAVINSMSILYKKF